MTLLICRGSEVDYTLHKCEQGLARCALMGVVPVVRINAYIVLDRHPALSLALYPSKENPLTRHACEGEGGSSMLSKSRLSIQLRQQRDSGGGPLVRYSRTVRILPIRQKPCLVFNWQRLGSGRVLLALE